jgi:hypothetical protein
MPNDEVQDIIIRLKELNLEQSALLNRLDTLRDTPAATAARIPPDPIRQIVVGDRVRIRNPGLLQPTSGTVTKVTAKRVTVQGQIGYRVSTIIRAPKNLILEE